MNTFRRSSTKKKKKWPEKYKTCLWAPVRRMYLLSNGAGPRKEAAFYPADLFIVAAENVCTAARPEVGYVRSHT